MAELNLWEKTLLKCGYLLSDTMVTKILIFGWVGDRNRVKYPQLWPSCEQIIENWINWFEQMNYYLQIQHIHMVHLINKLLPNPKSNICSINSLTSNLVGNRGNRWWGETRSLDGAVWLSLRTKQYLGTWTTTTWGLARSWRTNYDEPQYLSDPQTTTVNWWSTCSWLS